MQSNELRAQTQADTHAWTQTKRHVNAGTVRGRRHQVERDGKAWWVKQIQKHRRKMNIRKVGNRCEKQRGGGRVTWKGPQQNMVWFSAIVKFSQLGDSIQSALGKQSATQGSSFHQSFGLIRPTYRYPLAGWRCSCADTYGNVFSCVMKTNRVLFLRLGSYCGQIVVGSQDNSFRTHSSLYLISLLSDESLRLQLGTHTHTHTYCKPTERQGNTQ